MSTDDLASPHVRPAAEAITAAAGPLTAITTASKGPWYGFDGLWVLAVDGHALWIGRQNHASFVAEPTIHNIPLTRLVWTQDGDSTLTIAEHGTFRTRTPEDLTAFTTHLPQANP